MTNMLNLNEQVKCYFTYAKPGIMGEGFAINLMHLIKVTLNVKVTGASEFTI